MNTLAYVLVIIGGLNWGLVGINPSFDLVSMIGGGPESVVSKIVYILVGLSAIWLVVSKAKGGKTESVRVSKETTIDQQM